MSFALFLCGQEVGELAGAVPALLDELASRGLRARVLGDCLPEPAEPAQLEAGLREALGAGECVVVLLREPKAQVRAKLTRSVAEVVVVDWSEAAAPFEPSVNPHLSLSGRTGATERLAEVFAHLEGMGHVVIAPSESLNPSQEAELVGRLKDLGYL